MNIKAHIFSALFALLLVTGVAHAATTTIRYELTGTLNGELDGVALKGNSFDIVFVADTTQSTPDPSGIALRNLATSTSIRLSGYGSGTFSGGTFGLVTSPSISGVTFFYDNAGFTFQIVGISDSALSSWNLVTPIGPLTPTLSVFQGRDGQTTSTTIGALRIISATNLTFSATLADDPAVQARNAVFAEFADGRLADGSSYRSTLMVSSDSNTQIDCTLNMIGFTIPGFGSGNTRTFTVPPGGYSILTTPGTQSLRAGYATLNCTLAVSAQVLYSLYSQSGVLVSEATVFPSAAVTTAQLLADQRNGAQLAIAIANTAATPTDFVISVLDDNNNQVGSTSLQLPAQGQIAKFLNEMVSMPSGFVGRVLITTKPSIFAGVYAIGFRFNGQIFTTIPITAITYR